MKILKIFLFQFFFLGIFAGIVSAQNLDGNFTITTPGNQLTAGSQAVVTLNVSSQETINALQATLSYPQNKLTFEKIDATGSPFEIDLKSSGSNGEVKIARGTTKPVSGQNLVAKVSFQVNQTTNPGELTLVNPSLIASSTTNKNIFSGVTYHTVSGTNNQTVTQVSIPPRYLPPSQQTPPSPPAHKSFLDFLFSYIASLFHH